MKYLLIFSVFLHSCVEDRLNIIANSPVDRGLLNSSAEKVFSDARSEGYTKNLSAGLYTVKVKNDCATLRDGSKGFLIRADNYDGTEYDINSDQGTGEVYAAEQVDMVNGKPIGAFTICLDTPKAMYKTIRSGIEHQILFHNDPVKYKETETHRNGQGHPIIPIH